MNAKRILFLATVSGGLLFAPALSTAAVVSDIVIDSAQKTYAAPKPTQVVTPSGIARRFEGETIRVRLALDAAGQPVRVDLVGSQDVNLVRNLLPAVSQWRFSPAMLDGRPVAAQIELPILLVADPSA
jgi:hypothetical protein